MKLKGEIYNEQEYGNDEKINRRKKKRIKGRILNLMLELKNYWICSRWKKEQQWWRII